MQLTTAEREQQKQQHRKSTQRQTSRAVKNSVKTDKENVIEDLAKEVEDESAQEYTKQLYEITRTLSGKYKHSDRPIKDKNSNVLTYQW